VTILQKTLPTAPGGVLAVTQGFVSNTVPRIARSNNLHVIEAEVSCWNPFMSVGYRKVKLSCSGRCHQSW
jgi:hypothetical protein